MCIQKLLSIVLMYNKTEFMMCVCAPIPYDQSFHYNYMHVHVIHLSYLHFHMIGRGDSKTVQKGNGLATASNDKKVVTIMATKLIVNHVMLALSCG